MSIIKHVELKEFCLDVNAKRPEAVAESLEHFFKSINSWGYVPRADEPLRVESGFNVEKNMHLLHFKILCDRKATLDDAYAASFNKP